MDKITMQRKTTESIMTAVLEFSKIKADYRSKINTPIPFLNHMIEHIVWRGGFNLAVDVQLDKFFLSHVICEDLGITIGKAVAERISQKTADGIYGYGVGTGIIDEAMAQCAVSFESRTYSDINMGGINVPQEVEGMYSEDLATFLEGFSQGANCTLHVDLSKGCNGHHIWEAIFRAFGIALGAALTLDKSRAGMTSGVAGGVEFKLM